MEKIVATIYKGQNCLEHHNPMMDFKKLSVYEILREYYTSGLAMLNINHFH